MSTSSINLSERLRIERRAVETFYQAFSNKNPDLVDEVLTPSWDDIPLAPGQGAGPEGIKPIIQSVALAFPDIQITVHDMIQEPGRIGVRAEISGTHQGEIFGIHTLDGKRITTTWHMEDWFGLFLQLGQFPKQA
jgi:predicted ester cyclase